MLPVNVSMVMRGLCGSLKSRLPENTVEAVYLYGSTALGRISKARAISILSQYFGGGRLRRTFRQ